MSLEGALPDGLSDLGLIETILWTREDGYVLREGHAARMRDSAEALGFAFDARDFDRALARALADETASRLRVRLVLTAGGHIETTATPFAPETDGKLWRVAMSGTRFDSRDPLLRHKTTRRALYEDALAQAGDVDEVLFLNERGEVCEGARTNVFVRRDGSLLTPPVSSGLLPGVLRGDLLKRGEAREAALWPDDLRDGFFLGNSLRGLSPATLAAGDRSGSLTAPP